jgi:hypothetical protein
MRLFGYARDVDADEPLVLTEVSVVASAATLRRLAEFIHHAADELERTGTAFGHEHFKDYAQEMRSGPDVVVVGAGER